MSRRLDRATKARYRVNPHGQLGFVPPGAAALARVDATARGTGIDVGGLAAVNLLEGMSDWYPRDQDGRPTCVSHAAAAAVELLRAMAAAPGPGRRPERLSARFLHQRMLATRARRQDRCCDIVAGRSDAKLCEAAEVLKTEGICPESVWRESSWDLAVQPGAAARAAAEGIKAFTGVYEDHGLPGTLEEDPACRPPARQGLATRIHAELARRHPVCMAMPGWRAKSATGEDLFDPPMSWFMPKTLRSGIHPDLVEATDQTLPNGGHVVCLVGFQPDPAARGGGWFAFRNSWGARYGSWVPEAGTRPGTVPHLHGPGFGAVSAWYVERYCWEWLSLTLAAP